MIGRLIAVGAAMLAAVPAQAALFNYSYTFNDGSTVAGSFVGALSDAGDVFNVERNRLLSFNGRGSYGSVVPVTSIEKPTSVPPRIALYKTLIDLNIRRSPSQFILFGVGERLVEGLGFDAAFKGSFEYEEFRPDAFTFSIYQDATLNFTYELPDFVAASGRATTLSGTLAGWLTPDGTRFEVDRLSAFAVDGVAVPGELPAFSNDGFDFAPAVRLDKTLVDLALVRDPRALLDGPFVNLNSGTRSGAEFGSGYAGASTGYGGTGFRTAFDPARLTLSVPGMPAAAVPEPAGWAMMIVGFGLVGAAARRRPRTFAAA